MVHDILQISPDFLAKYGIDKNVSATERSCQAEKAYRELDARFVRMTGRRPYADEFFAFLRHGKEKVAEVDRPKTGTQAYPPEPAVQRAENGNLTFNRIIHN